MSKMACRCGGTIRDNLIPCPTEGWILRDQDQDAHSDGIAKDLRGFFAAVGEGRRAEWIASYFSPQYPPDISDDEVVVDILGIHERRRQLSVAECEQCGRLWVQKEPGVNEYRSYAPDEPGYAAVLRASSTTRVE